MAASADLRAGSPALPTSPLLAGFASAPVSRTAAACSTCRRARSNSCRRGGCLWRTACCSTGAASDQLMPALPGLPVAALPAASIAASSSQQALKAGRQSGSRPPAASTQHSSAATTKQSEPMVAKLAAGGGTAGVQHRDHVHSQLDCLKIAPLAIVMFPDVALEG